MARKPVDQGRIEALNAEMVAARAPKLFDINQFADARKEKKRVKRRDFSSQAEHWLQQTLEIVKRAKDEGGDAWKDAKPENLVALYAVMHKHVYGVLPHELSAEFPAAVSAAKKLLRDEFTDDVVSFVDFIRHIFASEQRSFRSRSSESNWRVQWRHLFMMGSTQNLKNLTTYRIALDRNRGAKKS